MVSFLNKETSIETGVDVKAKYGDLLLACLNSRPDGGFDIQEMRKRLRVIDVVEKGGDELLFEDADMATIVGCVSSMKWAVFSKEIVEFSDYVSSFTNKGHSC